MGLRPVTGWWGPRGLAPLLAAVAASVLVPAVLACAKVDKNECEEEGGGLDWYVCECCHGPSCISPSSRGEKNWSTGQCALSAEEALTLTYDDIASTSPRGTTSWDCGCSIDVDFGEDDNTPGEETPTCATCNTTVGTGGDPAQMCEGALGFFDALTACLCGEPCAAECGSNACESQPASGGCLDCMNTACATEYGMCLDH